MNWFLDPVTKHYADFTGRTTRQQFWMYILIYVVGYIVISAVSDTLAMLAALGLLLPNIAITARRLHDIGRSGWWQLIGLIPLIGLIVMIYWLVQPSQAEGNEYGPVPTDAPAAAPAATNMAATEAPADTFSNTDQPNS